MAKKPFDEAPLVNACPRCGADRGKRCVNYMGRNKFTCGPRLDLLDAPPPDPAPAPPPPPDPAPALQQRTLFDLSSFG